MKTNWPQVSVIKGAALSLFKTKPRGYKTFFMLNSTEHEVLPAYKC